MRTQSPDTAADTALRAYLLPTLEFDRLLVLQRHVVYEIAGDRTQAALIVCEHEPLVTVGRHGSRAHLLGEPEALAKRGCPVRWINRGGGCWLHVPGQLALYLIVSLDRLGLSPSAYVHRLQRALARAVAECNVRGAIDLALGSVCASGRPVAHVGVAVRDWVAYFGAILNVNPDLEPFRLVRGARDQPLMTSLERERSAPVRVANIRQRLVESIGGEFGFGRTTPFFDHPALRRKVARDALAAHR